MKSSLYNMYKRGRSGYVLLNTLTNATARIDEEIKTLLDRDPDNIPKDILEMLHENGFVVEDGCDEKKIVAYWFDKDKYNVFLRDLVYTVAVTYACNLGCPYCFQGTQKGIGILDTERADILLKNIDRNLSQKEFKALGLTLYGGEPLLAYRQCVQIMKGASRICDQQNKEFRGSIVTNGVLIDEEVVGTLLKPYCQWVQITMDGGREVHNKRKMRKDGSGTYDALLHVLELLRDAHVDVNLRLNVDRGNIDAFADLSRDLAERGLQDIKKYVGWVQPSHAERRGEGCSNYAETCFTVDEIVELENHVYRQMGRMRASDGTSLTFKHDPCMFDREDSYLVDPYLDLYNCWEFMGIKDRKVGHISESGEMVFNSEYYEQMSRNPLEIEECTDCTYLPFCAGGCAAYAYHENGTYHSSPCRKTNYSRTYLGRCIETILERVELLLLETGN